jgi:hypothetical protein
MSGAYSQESHWNMTYCWDSSPLLKTGDGEDTLWHEQDPQIVREY